MEAEYLNSLFKRHRVTFIQVLLREEGMCTTGMGRNMPVNLSRYASSIDRSTNAIFFIPEGSLFGTKAMKSSS